MFSVWECKEMPQKAGVARSRMGKPSHYGERYRSRKLYTCISLAVACSGRYVTEVTELGREKEKDINRKQNKIGKLLFLI